MSASSVCLFREGSVPSLAAFVGAGLLLRVVRAIYLFRRQSKLALRHNRPLLKAAHVRWQSHGAALSKQLRQLIRNAAALFGVVHHDRNLGPVSS